MHYTCLFIIIHDYYYYTIFLSTVNVHPSPLFSPPCSCFNEVVWSSVLPMLRLDMKESPQSHGGTGLSPSTNELSFQCAH